MTMNTRESNTPNAASAVADRTSRTRPVSTAARSEGSASQPDTARRAVSRIIAEPLPLTGGEIAE